MQSPFSRPKEQELSRRRNLAQAYRSFNFESILDKSYESRQNKKVWQSHQSQNKSLNQSFDASQY